MGLASLGDALKNSPKFVFFFFLNIVSIISITGGLGVTRPNSYWYQISYLYIGKFT